MAGKVNKEEIINRENRENLADKEDKTEVK